MKNESKIPIISSEQFMNYFLDNNYDENMFDSNGHINPDYNSSKKTGLIAQILEDNWDAFYEANKYLVDEYRPNAKEEFKKVIACHNKDLGSSVYQCPQCGDFIFIGNTCKSRCCSSCGFKYKLERVENIMSSAYNCPHRQIVFTIPKEFRKFFFFPLDRIDIIYQAVAENIYSLLNNSFKKTKKGKKKIYI